MTHVEAPSDDLLVWGSLHDGELLRIEGSAPGDVALHVGIPYLRNRFAPAGDGFVLRLAGCTRLELGRDDGETLDDPATITRRPPVLLSIVSEDPLAIYTTGGTLRLAYASLSLTLDTGEALAPEALDAASEAYWTDFAERTRTRGAT